PAEFTVDPYTRPSPNAEARRAIRRRLPVLPGRPPPRPAAEAGDVRHLPEVRQRLPARPGRQDAPAAGRVQAAPLRVGGERRRTGGRAGGGGPDASRPRHGRRSARAPAVGYGR